MTCPRCQLFFCWSCLSVISGYEHFKDNEKCNLWKGAEIERELKDDRIDFLTLTPQQIAEKKVKEFREYAKKLADNEVILCPMCDALNYRKSDRVNLIKCEECKCNFCFQCGKDITRDGLVHFEKSNCHHIEPQEEAPKIYADKSTKRVPEFIRYQDFF